MIQYYKADFSIDKLGSFYTEDKTIFRVFAPEHDTLFLILDDERHQMHKDHYTFEIEIPGDLEGSRYHFETGDGICFKDPFSYLSDDNDSFIMDKKRFIDTKIKPEKYRDIIIYEASVRDFSSDHSFPGRYKRKFLALAEEGLRKDGYYMLGMDYLKNLGITHLQLLPVLAFDHDHSDYNWGYNPVAFNYLQKDYVDDTDDHYAFVNEFRSVVNKYHENNIRIVLDVVFNHVYDARTFDMEKMIPGHFLRRKNDGTLAAGTLCGSEIRTEDVFVRQYLIEMAKRYVELFDIDGLRMDLMGIIDIDTMNEMRSTLKKIKDDFVIYGEGWNMGDVLDENERATIINADELEGIAMFNDRFRDTVISYIDGNIYNDIEDALCSEVPLRYDQSINYVECHDGYTFYDHLKKSEEYHSEEVIERKCRMALALIMFSKGIPFIHAGQEFMRSKKGIRNTYNCGDDVNGIDWNLRVKNNGMCDYVKDLIETRKNNGAFRRSDATISTFRYYECIIYRIDELTLFINPSNNSYVCNDGYEHHVIFDINGKCDYSARDIGISAYSVTLCKN